MTSTGCMKWRHLRSTKCIQWLDSFLGISQNSFLWVWSHLLKKSSMENFIFCVVINILFVVLGRIFINVLIIKLLASFTGSYQCFAFWRPLSVFFEASKIRFKKNSQIFGLDDFLLPQKWLFFRFCDSLINLFKSESENYLHGKYFQSDFRTSLSLRDLSTAEKS